MLSEEDRKRIAEAVTEAELGTTGEITCVLTEQVSNYREVPLAWAALVSLGLPPVLVLLDLHHAALGWVGDISADSLVLQALSTYAMVQTILFVGVALLANWRPLRRLLTPTMLKRHRVLQAARHHYAAVGTRLPRDAPHILIFACFEDHRVELVANPVIHAAEGQRLWDEAVGAVVQGMTSGQCADGFINAIWMCGAAMAQHFPAAGPDENRLSNEIVIL
jgi:putative membrane protein